MTNSRKKLLLLGPGHGNNLNVVLDLLAATNVFDISLLTQKYHSQNSDYSGIPIFEFYHRSRFVRRVITLITIIKVPSQDIMCILGGSNLYEVVPAMLFIRRKKTIFNIWSEGVPNTIGHSNFKSLIYKKVFSACDLIWCNWHGTANLLLRNAPTLQAKVRVQAWGLNQDFLQAKPIEHDFTKTFVSALPKDRVSFINMRSLTAYNEVDLILEATALIRDHNPDYYSKLLMIFWHGNNIDDGLLHGIKQHIKAYGMQDAIWCVDHPFLPSSDIRHVVEAVDVVVNYVKHDQLSLSMLEALYLEKQIIASDILAYRILNEKLETQLRLTPLNAKALAYDICACMKQVLDGEIDGELLVKRKRIVEANFGRDSVINGLAAMIKQNI